MAFSSVALEAYVYAVLTHLTSKEKKEGICMHHMTRSYSVYITRRTVCRFSRHYMHLVVIQVLTCSVAVWHSESLGLLNYGFPFFPISCLLSPSCNLHFMCIPFSILHPSQYSCSYSSSLQFTLKHLLTVLSWSILTTCPIHCNLFFFVIINIKDWSLWSIPSPHLQLLAPTLLWSSSCSSLWSVVVWFQRDSVLWLSLQV